VIKSCLSLKTLKDEMTVTNCSCYPVFCSAAETSGRIPKFAFNATWLILLFYNPLGRDLSNSISCRHRRSSLLNSFKLLPVWNCFVQSVLTYYLYFCLRLHGYIFCPGLFAGSLFCRISCKIWVDFYEIFGSSSQLDIRQSFWGDSDLEMFFSLHLYS